MAGKLTAQPADGANWLAQGPSVDHVIAAQINPGTEGGAMKTVVGNRCFFLDVNIPTCPVNRGEPIGGLTTHTDLANVLPKARLTAAQARLGIDAGEIDPAAAEAASSVVFPTPGRVHADCRAGGSGYTAAV